MPVHAKASHHDTDVIAAPIALCAGRVDRDHNALQFGRCGDAQAVDAWHYPAILGLAIFERPQRAVDLTRPLAILEALPLGG